MNVFVLSHFETVISYDTVCLCRFYLDKDIEML